MDGYTRGKDERTFSIRFGQGVGRTVFPDDMKTLVSNFNMIEEVGGFSSLSSTALAWTYEFEAVAPRCQIDLMKGPINKPVLNGFTLQALPQGD
jgi:hypothetical protein